MAAVRPSPAASLTVPLTQNTAPAFEFRCLYTRDLKRKAKRWQDGWLTFHTFNNRVVVYDEERNYVGDSHRNGSQDARVQEGDEFTLDRGSVMVEVSEFYSSSQTDLAELRPRKPQQRPDATRPVRSGYQAPALQRMPIPPRPQPPTSRTPMDVNRSVEARIDRQAAPLHPGLQAHTPVRPRNDESHAPLWQLLRTSRPREALQPVHNAQHHSPVAKKKTPKQTKKQTDSAAQSRLRVKELIDLTSQESTVNAALSSVAAGPSRSEGHVFHEPQSEARHDRTSPAKRAAPIAAEGTHAAKRPRLPATRALQTSPVRHARPRPSSPPVSTTNHLPSPAAPQVPSADIPLSLEDAFDDVDSLFTKSPLRPARPLQPKTAAGAPQSRPREMLPLKPQDAAVHVETPVSEAPQGQGSLRQRREPRKCSLPGDTTVIDVRPAGASDRRSPRPPRPPSPARANKRKHGSIPHQPHISDPVGRDDSHTRPQPAGKASATIRPDQNVAELARPSDPISPVQHAPERPQLAPSEPPRRPKSPEPEPPQKMLRVHTKERRPRMFCADPTFMRRPAAAPPPPPPSPSPPPFRERCPSPVLLRPDSEPVMGPSAVQSNASDPTDAQQVDASESTEIDHQPTIQDDEVSATNALEDDDDASEALKTAVAQHHDKPAVQPLVTPPRQDKPAPGTSRLDGQSMPTVQPPIPPAVEQGAAAPEAQAETRGLDADTDTVPARIEDPPQQNISPPESRLPEPQPEPDGAQARPEPAAAQAQPAQPPPAPSHNTRAQAQLQGINKPFRRPALTPSISAPPTSIVPPNAEGENFKAGPPRQVTGLDPGAAAAAREGVTVVDAWTPDAWDLLGMGPPSERARGVDWSYAPVPVPVQLPVQQGEGVQAG